MDGDNIVTLQRRFLEVYSRYVEYHPNSAAAAARPDNLMIACLEHLIPFCCWARQDDQISEWIHAKLLSKPDLRPEVRNGIALIIIYTFASAKAHVCDGDSDMFSVLQDHDTGFGIVNKTSVKVYNDPFNYFEFLKVSLIQWVKCVIDVILRSAALVD
jgi:hypothetical protein